MVELQRIQLLVYYITLIQFTIVLSDRIKQAPLDILLNTAPSLSLKDSNTIQKRQNSLIFQSQLNSTLNYLGCFQNGNQTLLQTLIPTTGYYDYNAAYYCQSQANKAGAYYFGLQPNGCIFGSQSSNLTINGLQVDDYLCSATCIPQNWQLFSNDSSTFKIGPNCGSTISLTSVYAVKLPISASSNSLVLNETIRSNFVIA